MSARVAAQNPVPSERTFLTFSNSVEMPGVTLPAGTYVFRLADSPTRNVVQVLTKDEKDIVGQWTFVQAQRPKATEDTVVMFKEMPEGMTPAVQYWYYPGETIGKEFIYPKDQAQRIANRTGVEVLSEEGRVASTVTSTDSKGNVVNWERDNGNAAAAAPQASSASEASLRNAPAPAQPTAAAGSTTGNRGAQAQADNSQDSAVISANASQSPAVAERPSPVNDRPVGTSGVAEPQAGNTQPRASALPQTASPAPMVGLIGLLALAAAFGTRRLAAMRH